MIVLEGVAVAIEDLVDDLEADAGRRRASGPGVLRDADVPVDGVGEPVEGAWLLRFFAFLVISRRAKPRVAVEVGQQLVDVDHVASDGELVGSRVAAHPLPVGRTHTPTESKSDLVGVTVLLGDDHRARRKALDVPLERARSLVEVAQRERQIPFGVATGRFRTWASPHICTVGSPVWSGGEIGGHHRSAPRK
jgi:hypothetical protein